MLDKNLKYVGKDGKKQSDSIWPLDLFYSKKPPIFQLEVNQNSTSRYHKVVCLSTMITNNNVIKVHLSYLPTGGAKLMVNFKKNQESFSWYDALSFPSQ